MNYIRASISKIDSVDNVNIVSFIAGSVSLKNLCCKEAGLRYSTYFGGKVDKYFFDEGLS